MSDKKRLLWIGDHSCESGFARASQETLAVLKEKWEIAVIALNYFGDPTPFDYDVFPAFQPGGDGFGLSRVKDIVEKFRPHVVLIQNDPWNIKAYLKRLKEFKGLKVASMPVDGKNCSSAEDMNELDLAIFWTKFAEKEAVAGGFTGESAIIPLGVHPEVFYPSKKSKAEIRKMLDLPEKVHDAFIIGNVNRNQPRKRLDLTVEYFCDYVKTYGDKNAYLFMHVCPTGDMGWDLYQLMKYRGMEDRLILSDVGINNGFSDKTMNALYNALDVLMSTTLGEGWGLPASEAMACRVPVLAPDWSALGDWTRGSSYLVPCTTFSCTPNFVNVIGGVADRRLMVQALYDLHSNVKLREGIAQSGYDLVMQDRFRWKNIGERFNEVLTAAVEKKCLVSAA